MVIRLCLALLFVLEVGSFPLSAQTKSTSSDIFSGTVTSSQNDSVTVVRKVPARADESRAFAVDKETTVEGHLKVNARVTVRFMKDAGGGFHALHIIVRADSKLSPGRGTKRVR